MSDCDESVDHIDISTWDELLSHAQPGRVFRGQENGTWDLKTKLERACERIDADLLRADIRERALLRDFRRRFHQYSHYRPQHDDDLEWLSIMQHYGAPTRLLDWTYSLPVATYFALYNASLGATQSAAVWYLSEEWCNSECERALNRAGKDGAYMRGRVEDFPANEFFRLFMDVPPEWDGVALVNPFRLDVRLRNQRGVFTAVGNVRKPCMENVQAFPDWRSHVRKLMIPPSLFKQFLERLAEMNVTHTLLFPGLEGFAVSLDVYDPTLWP